MARSKRNNRGQFVKKATKRRTSTKKKAGRVSRPKKRTRSASKGAKPMATKKKRTGTRRRTSSRVLGGLNGAVVKDVGVMTAAMLATNIAVDKLPLPAQMRTGGGRIAGKAAVAIGGSILLKRFAGASIAGSFLKGGLMSVATDLYAMAVPAQAGVAGIPYGYERLNGMGSIGYFPPGRDDELDAIMAGYDASLAA